MVEWVVSSRGRLIAAILTLVRGWYAAGQPTGNVPVIGGFDAWAKTVGGILAYARVEGFLGNLDQMYERADEEGREWEGFLRALSHTFGDRPITTAVLIDALQQGTLIAEALPNDIAEMQHSHPGGFSRRLGRALAKKVDTRFGDDDLRIIYAGTAQNAKLWLVVKG